MSDQSKIVDTPSLRAAFPSESFFSGSVEVKQLAGDASSRCYYRLTSARERMSLVLQVADSFPAEDAARHPFLCAQQLLHAVGVPVPRVLATDGVRGWVLLEDLGDETLQNRGVGPALYKKSLDIMTRWHREVRLDSPLIPAELKAAAPHFGWAFDEAKLGFEMGFTAEHYFEKMLGMPQDRFLPLMQKTVGFLSAQPRYFCHRDFHSRNVMVKGSKLFIIDFQDARMGPLAYDLVSLLWDPYVRSSEEDRSELLKAWKTGLGKMTVPANFEEELERMKIQRLLKAVGSYASFFNRKGNSSYLPHVKPALHDAREAIRNLINMKLAFTEEIELLTLLSAIQH